MVSEYPIKNSSSGHRKAPTWTHGFPITVFLIIEPFSMIEANQKAGKESENEHRAFREKVK